MKVVSCSVRSFSDLSSAVASWPMVAAKACVRSFSNLSRPSAPWPTVVTKASVRSFSVLSRAADSSVIDAARSLVRSFSTVSMPMALWPTSAAKASVRSFSVLSRPMAPWPTRVAKASVRSFIVLSRPADSALIEAVSSLVRSFNTLSRPMAPWPTDAAKASVRSFNVLSRISAPCDTVDSSALMREASVVVRASVRSFKRMVERGRALADGDFQRREVARRAFDDLAEALLLLAEALEQDRHMLLHLALRALHLLRRFVAAGDEELGELRSALGELLVDARARGGQIAGDLLADAAQGLADPLAVVGKRLALARKLADQAADAKLVVAIGALERRHLVMHQGLELAGAADGAGNCVVHGGDLAADGLSQGGDGLLGELVRLGEADRDLGHGRGHQPQFLGAPDEQRQEPENGDRHENGDEGGERRRDW